LESELHEAYLEVNPEDAGSIGVSAEELVKVASRRGEIKLKVRVTDRVGKGVVFMPFHFAEAAANALTNTALDPVAKIPEYKVCAVKVEKA
jgi:predicted molibdopterin-dependent oxidoreductase YjgC